jgi:hypothetical protein
LLQGSHGAKAEGDVREAGLTRQLLAERETSTRTGLLAIDADVSPGALVELAPGEWFPGLGGGRSRGLNDGV